MFLDLPSVQAREGVTESRDRHSNEARMCLQYTSRAKTADSTVMWPRVSLSLTHTHTRRD